MVGGVSGGGFGGGGGSGNGSRESDPDSTNDALFHPLANVTEKRKTAWRQSKAAAAVGGTLATNAFKNNMGPRGVPVHNRAVAAEERRWRNAAHQAALDEINNRGKVGPDRNGSPHHRMPFLSCPQETRIQHA